MLFTPILAASAAPWQPRVVRAQRTALADDYLHRYMMMVDCEDPTDAVRWLEAQPHVTRVGTDPNSCTVRVVVDGASPVWFVDSFRM